MCVIMKRILLAAFILVCLCSPASAELRQVYVIVNMGNAPVEILESRQCHARKKDHICSQVKYKNRTDKNIEALAITMIYFDAFNDKLDGVRGISTGLLNAQGESAGYWSVYVGEPGFVKTAVAFVSAVRFLRNEEVWKADVDEVVKVAADMPELNFLLETEMLEIEKKCEIIKSLY